MRLSEHPGRSKKHFSEIKYWRSISRPLPKFSSYLIGTNLPKSAYHLGAMSKTSETQQTNPLREGLATRAVPQACTVVIFGATGDLTMRKLIPALYNIAADGELPPAVTVVGFARRPKDDELFRKEQEEATRKFSRQTVRDEIWNGFAPSIYYHQSEFHDASGYKSLVERLEKIDQERGTGGNRLFYLAVAPDQFEAILKNLKD